MNNRDRDRDRDRHAVAVHLVALLGAIGAIVAASSLIVFLLSLMRGAIDSLFTWKFIGLVIGLVPTIGVGSWFARLAAKKLRPGQGADRRTRRTRSASVGALTVLELLSVVVPKRLGDEEIGDAIEVICRLAEQRQSAWLIYLTLASRVFWIGMGLVNEVSSSILGKAKAR